MKYVKMLGLLAAAAAALMAFAGTASATLTDGTAGGNATLIHASAGTTSLTGGLTITCHKSTVAGHITTNDANHASGPVTTLDFTECNHTVSVHKKGTLTITDTDGTTAAVTSDGAEVTVLLHSFLLGTVHCTFITSNTPIGTLTESDHTPAGGSKHTTATMHITGSIPTDDATSDGPCPTHATWEGTYEVITPDHLVLD